MSTIDTNKQQESKQDRLRREREERERQDQNLKQTAKQNWVQQTNYQKENQTDEARSIEQIRLRDKERKEELDNTHYMDKPVNRFNWPTDAHGNFVADKADAPTAEQQATQFAQKELHRQEKERIRRDRELGVETTESTLPSALKTGVPVHPEMDHLQILHNNILFKRIRDRKILIRKYSAGLNSSIEWEVILQPEDWDEILSSVDQTESEAESILRAEDDNIARRVSAGSSIVNEPTSQPSVLLDTPTGRIVGPIPEPGPVMAEENNIDPVTGQVKVTEPEKKLGRVDETKEQSLLGERQNLPPNQSDQ